MEVPGLLITVLTSLLISYSHAKDYSGYHVFTATPRSEGQVDDLAKYLMEDANQEHIDIWTLPKDVQKDAKFMVSGDFSVQMEMWLSSRSIEHEIATTDIQSWIEEEAIKEAALNARSKARLGRSGLDLNVYNNHSEMNQFLETMADKCDVCQTINIGQTYEGRDMVVIKIGRYEVGKPAIWIDAGIHAREWVAPATALNVINKLVTGYLENDEYVMAILDNFIVYVLPSANPDGYTYSRQHDRLWRKTRQPTQRPGCIGVDPNRNWNFHWAESGVSPNQCSDIFPGGIPFSEPETRNMRKFLWQRRKQIIVYLSFHSYGQYWLYPWGYDDSLPEDWEELHRVGRYAKLGIMEAGGPEYTLGSSTHVLYAAAGASDDWAKGVAGIKYSYTVELPDTGYYGFLLPPEHIESTFTDIWFGLMNMAEAVKQYLDGNIPDDK